MFRQEGLSRRDFMNVAAGRAAGLWLGGCATRGRPFADLPPSAMGPVPKGDWPSLAQLALSRIKAGGCSYGDIRLLETHNQSVRAEDRRISNVAERFDSGFGIRALYKGAWGFAASADFTPEEIERTADRAVEIARASFTLMKTPVTLAEEPVHKDRVKTTFQI